MEKSPIAKSYFLKLTDKSDWDINEQSEPLVTITKNGHQRSAADFDNIIDSVSGKKIHFAMSLIWDQVKECRVNREDPDDIELVSISMTLDDESKLPQHLRKKQ
jgi:hypothetical protein